MWASDRLPCFNFTTGQREHRQWIAALKFNTSGSDNTALGMFALSVNTTGSRNTALGANAGPDLWPSCTPATPPQSERMPKLPLVHAMVLGSINGVNGATADTLVGIGTTAPAAKTRRARQRELHRPITFCRRTDLPRGGNRDRSDCGIGSERRRQQRRRVFELEYHLFRWALGAATSREKYLQRSSKWINNSVGIGTPRRRLIRYM